LAKPYILKLYSTILALILDLIWQGTIVDYLSRIRKYAEKGLLTLELISRHDVIHFSVPPFPVIFL